MELSLGAKVPLEDLYQSKILEFARIARKTNLLDNSISFLGEILSNQIITKGIDLGRTLWGQNHTGLAPNDLKFLFNSFFNRFA